MAYKKSVEDVEKILGDLYRVNLYVVFVGCDVSSVRAKNALQSKKLTKTRKKSRKAYAPHLRCCISAALDHLEMVDRAIEIGAKKVQLFKHDFNKEMIDKAHAYGIKCNVFFSDTPSEAAEFIKMGVDCILTNDYLAIKNALEERKLL